MGTCGVEHEAGQAIPRANPSDGALNLWDLQEVVWENSAQFLIESEATYSVLIYPTG